MKRCILIGSLLLFSALNVLAQKEYTLQSEAEGLSAFTKMGKARLDGVLKPVVLLKVVNSGDSAVQYMVEMDFFFQGKRIESLAALPMCLDAGKTSQGKLNGMYFQSESLTSEQMLSDDFEYELSIDIEDKESLCPRD